MGVICANRPQAVASSLFAPQPKIASDPEPCSHGLQQAPQQVVVVLQAGSNVAGPGGALPSGWWLEVQVSEVIGVN